MKELRSLTVSVVTLLAGAFILGTAGCDGSNSGGESVADAQQLSPTVEGIARRAEERWDHLAAGDFEAAYAFESPGYRDTVPLAQYQAQFGKAVRWLGVSVSNVELSDSGDSATVKLVLRYEGPAPGGGTYEGDRLLLEQWLLSDGRWWHMRD